MTKYFAPTDFLINYSRVVNFQMWGIIAQETSFAKENSFYSSKYRWHYSRMIERTHVTFWRLQRPISHIGTLIHQARGLRTKTQKYNFFFKMREHNHKCRYDGRKTYGLSFIRAAGASNFWNSRLTSESCFLTSRLLNFSVIFSYSWKKSIQV